jgi:hypothetical protein
MIATEARMLIRRPVADTNTGFSGDEKAIAKQAVEATDGFALVLPV